MCFLLYIGKNRCKGLLTERRNMLEKNVNKEGIMFIFSAPSGAGKSTIINRVVQELGDVYVSVSATTRSPREGEVDGKDYFFVSKEKFQKMINENAFYEYVDSDFGPKYGTPKAKIDENLAKGKDVILDIDYPGVQMMKAIAADKIKTIFIMPPSIEELRNRLIKRGTDSLETIEKRMSMAEKRIAESKFYDYIVINNDLETAVHDVLKVIKDERAKKNNIGR